MGSSALRRRGVVVCGRRFAPRELRLIAEVVESFPGLSRLELAHTICELLTWRRSSGKLKARECLDLLEVLEADGVIGLPPKRMGKPAGTRTSVPVTAAGEPREELAGALGELEPIVLEMVSSQEQRLLFRELVGRHHYVGHAVPFGAHVRYLVYASQPERAPLGCLQFSSPAWRMAVRDRWIGWDDRTRLGNLQRVVSNSRFLILPWIHVPNLASRVLSLAARQMVRDWVQRYGVQPLLLETLVDPARYGGKCYPAANWIELGMTTGRGRMDRERLRAAPKRVFVYPLVRDACRRLRET
jgi:hypothetical protein